jgi:hypothetical protein
VRHRAHADWARCAIVPNPAFFHLKVHLAAEMGLMNLQSGRWGARARVVAYEGRRRV